jgi:fatty acid desaturase
MTSSTVVRAEHPAATGSDFAELRRRVTEAGLLERQPWTYVLRFTLVGVAMALGWTWFVATGNSWWTLVPGAFLALVTGQTALLAHDLAHRQVFRTLRPTEIAGLVVGDLWIGMGYGWWMDKHNRHHANPNHEDLDPDVTPQLLTWSQRQAGASVGVTKFMSRYLGRVFPFLLLFEGFNLHVSALRSVVKPGLRYRRSEAVLLAIHFAAYFGLIFAVLPVGKAVVFVLVNQCLFGFYLGSTFAPNHKGMPTLTGKTDLDFLRKQVLTSRNIRGGRFINTAMGGLNVQIEHHLFPSMPSANLPKARPIVRAYCEEIGVPYAETGLLTSYRLALAHLHDVGAPNRS